MKFILSGLYKMDAEAEAYYRLNNDAFKPHWPVKAQIEINYDLNHIPRIWVNFAQKGKVYIGRSNLVYFHKRFTKL